MPQRCNIRGCRSNYDTEAERTTILSLPTDATRRKLWLDRIPTDLSKLKRPGVCLKHFQESDIIRVDRVLDRGVMRDFPRIRPKLTENAVPTIFPTTPPASQKYRRPRKKRRRCDDNDDEGDKMDTVVQQIIMNPPDVIIKEEPVEEEEVGCAPDDVLGAGTQQDFQYVSVKEEPIEDHYESTSPAPEESCERNCQDQELPLIIKEEIDCDDNIDPLSI